MGMIAEGHTTLGQKTVWYTTTCARCGETVKQTWETNSETICYDCGMGNVADEDADMAYIEVEWEI